MGRILDGLAAGFDRLRRFVPGDQAELASDDALVTYRDACLTAYRRGGLPGLVYEGVRGWIDLVWCAARVRLGRSAGRHRGEQTWRPTPPTRRLTMLFDDLRHAWQRLRSRPSTSLLAVSMLAAGIGLSTAMFTVVDALILRPAPFRDPGTLTWLGFGTPSNFERPVPLPIARALRSSGAFAATHTVVQYHFQFSDAPAGADMEAGALVTPGLFDDLGVRPILGRTFLASEGGPGADDRLLISESVWQTRFGGDPKIIGRRVRVSGTPVEIVGVLPAWVRFPFPNSKVWQPMDSHCPPTLPGGQPLTRVNEFARLPPTPSREAVADRASRAVHGADPTTAKGRVIYSPLSHLDDYTAELVGLLAWGVGLVFLVLCANVTNLILVRLGARRAELAVCAALGASRARLIREACLEHGLLIGAASLLGIGITVGLISLARAYLPPSIVGVTLHPLALDVRSFLATALLGAVALLVAGLLPAWTATATNASSSLRVTTRQVTVSRPTRRLTSILLVTEVALAVALSLAAGLQLRTFVNLLNADQGFDVAHLLDMRLSLPTAHFSDGPGRFVYAKAILDTVKTIPGVEGASLSDGMPPGNGWIEFWDVLPDRPGAAPVHLTFNSFEVVPNFFDVLRIRLVGGRAFQPGDPPTDAVLSATMAAKLFPGASALDHTIQFNDITYRVIGVAAEIRDPLIDPREDTPQFYTPLLAPSTTGTSPDHLMTAMLSVRCNGACPPPADLRAAVAGSAPLAVVGSPQRLLDTFSASLSRPRIGAILALTFAAIALLAFGGGLFAVLSRVVLERQREFGIRTALGARPADLAWLVRSNGAMVAVAGFVGGTLLAWLLARTLAAAEYQVGVADPLVWSAVCGTVSLSILAASWRPGRRAARIDPVCLLREE